MDLISRRIFLGSATALGSALISCLARASGQMGGNARHSGMAEQWWHKATVYQIYPASFCDSNGDGIGDIAGIISKLGYLQRLGIDLIWLSPVYTSPMVDNGYDISDYRAINPIFGTLPDMDSLIAAAKARRIGIVMDLVVNHTSNQHQWFESARLSRQSEFRDYYIWRDPKSDGSLPNDMQSAFGGPAWTYDKVSGQYYFHLFAPEQPDLNWANPHMRQAVYRMMNWWLNRGVAGFRMDVIDLIGKDIDKKITANGPMLHHYIQEMHQAALRERDCVTVGEVWSATPESAPLYSDPSRNELSMIFQFEHVTKFWDERLGKWKPKHVDPIGLKTVFNKWQTALGDHAWNSLFWGNHDLPRAVSRYGNDTGYRVESAKMLATVLHLMKGTPYIYQGEEIGMTNAGFTNISQYRDLETLNFHQIQLKEGMSESDFLQAASANSRDNARTPVQWSDAANAGFTTGKPWIAVNKNYLQVNVKSDVDKPNGVFQRYQQLIKLRKELPIIRHGNFKLIAETHPAVFAYQREYEGQTLVVIANFTGQPTQLKAGEIAPIEGWDLITSNQRRIDGEFSLSPYQTITVYKK